MCCPLCIYASCLVYVLDMADRDYALVLMSFFFVNLNLTAL